MTNKTAATRYARALLDVAVKEKADLEQIERELAAFADLFTQHPTLEKVLLNPAVPVAAQARRGGRADWRSAELPPIVAEAARAARRARSPGAAARSAGVVPRAAARSPERRPRRGHDGDAARGRPGAGDRSGASRELTGRTVTLDDAASIRRSSAASSRASAARCTTAASRGSCEKMQRTPERRRVSAATGHE